MTQTRDFYEIISAGGESNLRLRGDWTMDYAEPLEKALKKLSKTQARAIDASQIERMDIWGAVQLKELMDKMGAPANLNEHQKKIFTFIPDKNEKLPREEIDSTFEKTFQTFGEVIVGGIKTAYGITCFVGEIFVVFLKNLVKPSGFRFHSIIRHIDETGFRALPIIGLLSVLISMVISYQAATQLARFGATIYTIDLTVISLLREMGVLLTAIMVAGRSGSAFAAEIGVMKLREEVDALKTMGMNPIEVLVLPRLIATMITLPILAFLAVMIGLAGGAVISIILLDIPLAQYIGRVEMVAKPTMFFVGMVKAPVFAFIITIIGCYQGMNVTGSAESVGKLTTVAVVQSIFLVIMADALFSVLFSNMGL